MTADNELVQLVREIAKDLALETAGIWNVETTEHNVLLVNRGGLKMQFTAIAQNSKQPFNERRLHVQPWQWPTWVDWANDEPTTKQTSPRDMYNPEDISPDITVAISRGSAAIAREIKRRFLSEYIRIYARLVEKARENQKYAEAARDNWRDVCKILTDAGKPHSPKRNHASIDIAGRYLQIQNRGHVVHIEADLLPEHFKQIIEALTAKK